MAALGQPAAGVPAQPVPTVAQTKTFTEFYNDASLDEFHGVYDTVMSVFASPGTATNTPAVIRDLVSSDPRNSSMGYVVLVVSPQQPAAPGLIYGMHTISKYATRLGHPATPWDNELFASLHDVVGNQIPATVHFPADAFVRQGQGAHYRVALGQTLDAEFGADANKGIVGPFAAGDAGADLISCRNVVGVPHRYMRHFIPGPLTPRQAWETLVQDIIANGDGASCAPLVNFIRLSCTIHTAGDTASPLHMDPFTVQMSDANLITHHTALIEHKLPGLNQTPTMAAGQAIAASVSELATEQRAYRQDMADRALKSATKTVDDYFGASLQGLLRMCNVTTVAALPPIYQTLADHGRKKHRATLQHGMDEMMGRMGLQDLTCVMTADLATKISDNMWTNHSEDLSVGIHPFSLGEMNPDTIVRLQEVARSYDMIALGSVAPNLMDCQSLLVGAMGKFCIPSSLIALDAQNHIFLAFLNVFFGQTHAVTMAWGQHTHTTKLRLSMLMSYRPKTPRHAFLLPALIQRWSQLRWSYWLQCQQSSMANEPPPQWNELWRAIQLQTDWETPLPERYLAPVLPSSTAAVYQPLPTGALPPVPVPSAPAATSTPAAARDTTTVELSASYDDIFLPYKETGQRIRDILKKAKEAGNPLPKNAWGGDMCVSYHVKGVCNTNCGRKADHRPHNAADKKKLLDWCILAFPAAT